MGLCCKIGEVGGGTYFSLGGGGMWLSRYKTLAVEYTVV